MRTAIAITLLTLTGCAVCERHPVVCTGVVAIAGASIAATVRLHRSRPPRPCILTPAPGDVLLPPGYAQEDCR